MLTKLEIVNGVMTPNYDIYNDNYTVIVKEDVISLDINYELVNSDVTIQIEGNENLNNEENLVIIRLKNRDIKRTVYLNVIKETTESTAGLKDYFTSLEVKKKERIPEYAAPLIGSVCFLLIVIAFSILFNKKKKLK